MEPSFLYHSQTFLGVLITLNILCIFASKNSEPEESNERDWEDDNGDGASYNVEEDISENNFILRFLHHYKLQFRRRLMELKTTIRIEHESFSDSKDFKVLMKIQQGWGKYKDEIVQAAVRLGMKYTFNLTDSKAKATSGYVELDRIEASNEQRRAPLFTLLFGLVCFMVDEVVNWFGAPVLSGSIVFGWFFLLLSSLYWGALWSAFWIRRSFSDIKPINVRGFWNSVDKCLGSFWGGCIKIALCGWIFYIGLWLNIWNADHSTWYCYYVCVFALAPIALIGGLREIGCRVKGRYSMMHILGHLASCAVYAVVLTVIAFGCFEERILALEFFENISALRFWIIVFSLFNGLILPFAFPYFRLRLFYHSESKILESAIEQIKRDREAFGIEVGELCKKHFSTEEGEELS